MTPQGPSEIGKTTWVIPDAYLPSSDLGSRWEGHESVCVLNPNHRDATLTFTLLFEDLPEVRIHPILVRARSDRHIGMHKPDLLQGVVVPRDVCYGILIESDVPVVVQYSRLDTTQPNFTLMTTIPFGH